MKYPKYLPKHTRNFLDRLDMKQAWGTVNSYFCPECEKVLYTKDVDTGVTPMMLKCLDCGNPMESALYNVQQDDSLVGAEFYRPDDAEFSALYPDLQEHCRQGGLLFRMLDVSSGDQNDQ